MYKYDDEQRSIISSIKAIRDDINILGIKKDPEEFMQKAIQVLQDIGCFEMFIPEEYGGCPYKMKYAITILAEVAKVNPSLSQLLMVHNLGFCKMLNDYGKEEQKNLFFKSIVEERKVAAFAFHEPKGSNYSDIQLIAAKQDDFYILNGSKTMITYVNRADYIVIIAKIDKSSEFGYFIVDCKNTNGITFGKSEDTMGMKGISVSDITFSNSRILAKNLIFGGKESNKLTMESVAYLRAGNAAIAYGISDTAVRAAVAYARNRKLKEQTLIQEDICKSNIGMIYSLLANLELLVFSLGEQLEVSGGDIFTDASIVKYLTTEIAKKICDESLQIHGGYGYIYQYEIEQLYRDIRITTINGGTSEVIKLTIGEIANQLL